jgi:hypothetical protein
MEGSVFCRKSNDDHSFALDDPLSADRLHTLYHICKIRAKLPLGLTII